jgi:RNA polymerase sigma-70 factor (ECF subfamily)
LFRTDHPRCPTAQSSRSAILQSTFRNETDYVYVELFVNEVEQTVVAAAQQGDHRAFRTLVDHYDAGLRSLAFRLLGTSASMEDALQESYLKAYRALPAFRGDSSPGTWLYRITYNTCLDELRRRRQVIVLPLSEVTDCPDPAPEPGERFGLRTSLSRALAGLPPDQRAAVLLVDAQGFDYLAASEVLGIPDGTLRSRLSRARSRLRDVLADHDEAANSQ